MTAEEDQNIDYFIDYKDFESNLESDKENEEDSFNDDIIKIYEDHKKNFGSNNKSTEILNSQRPISKYQRNAPSANRNEDEKDFLELENSDYKLTVENVENLFVRFNKFLGRNKILKNEFLENENIYMTTEDFKDLFKKIRFEISTSELNYLFKFKNETAKEGYILGKHFLKSFRDTIIFSQEEKEEEQETSLKISPNEVNFEEMKNLEPRLINENTGNTFFDNNPKPNVTNRFHKEFKILNDQILEIVKRNDISSAKNKNLSNQTIRNKSIARIKSSIPIRKDNKVQFEIFNTYTGPNIVSVPAPQSAKNKISRPYSTNKLKPITTLNIKNIIEEKTRKRKAEDELVKLTLEKRNKEYERECIKKMSEANLIAEKVGVMKSYSAYFDEKEGLICRVFEKETKTLSEINLKNFLFEYKRLKKYLKVF